MPEIDFEFEEIVGRIKKGTRMRMIALVAFFLLTIFWLAVSPIYNFLVGRKASVKMGRVDGRYILYLSHYLRQQYPGKKRGTSYYFGSYPLLPLPGSCRKTARCDSIRGH